MRNDIEAISNQWLLHHRIWTDGFSTTRYRLIKLIDPQPFYPRHINDSLEFIELEGLKGVFIIDQNIDHINYIIPIEQVFLIKNMQESTI